MTYVKPDSRANEHIDPAGRTWRVMLKITPPNKSVDMTDATMRAAIKAQGWEILTPGGVLVARRSIGGKEQWLQGTASSGDYRFVLVPGGREIAWPKLRALLGVNRLSMPPADVALEVTGYERGTITPLGSSTPWPVVADAGVRGTISIGGGAHGVGLTVDAQALVDPLGATTADVTGPG